MYFVCACCHRPATCHGGWRIKLHNFSDPCRVAWLGKGSLRVFLLFLYLTWEEATRQWRLRQDGGRRDAGLYICHVRQRSKVGACEARQFPFMKALDLLSDLRPTESKCQYFSTYLAPPKDDPTLNSACLKTATPGSLFTVSHWCLICISQFKRITSFPSLHFFLSTGLANPTKDSRATLDLFLARLCMQTWAAKLELFRDGQGKCTAMIWGQWICRELNMFLVKSTASHFWCRETWGSFLTLFYYFFFFFCFGEPKISSFENLHSEITISSFYSMSGSRLFSYLLKRLLLCRIIVNTYKIRKIAAAATIVRNTLSPRSENYFLCLFFHIPLKIIINSCSNNNKIIIS